MFGEGKYKRRARQTFISLAGKEDEAIPLNVLNERLRSRQKSLEMSDAQIRAFVKAADTNNDALINLEEFEGLMSTPLARSTRTQRVMRTLANGVTAPNQRLEVHSYIDEYNCCPPPIFILVITLVQIFAFFGFFWAEKTHKHNIMTECAGCFVAGKPGPFIFVPKLRAEAWRFFTYQFAHAGLTHLLGNVIMQLLIGVPLEIVHKIYRIGPLYCLAVLAGSLLQYTLDPTVLLVGASAGVYALITAHLANVVINWNEMPFRFVRLAIVGVFILFDVGAAIYRRVYAGECDMVSHSAHIAGGITGFCFGVFILYNLVEHKWEKVVRIVCAVIFGVFFLVIIGFTIFQAPTSKAIWSNKDCGANQ